MLLLLAIASLFVLPSPWGFVAVGVAAAIEVVELAFWRRFLRRYKVQTGTEALIGTRAEVLEPCTPRGRVRVGGEIWNARSDSPVARGEYVRITAVEGLTLSVEPLGTWP
ncbi:MAG: NfeD family protein [Microbacterium sp.]|uniref:NfeD family protein n=1 Tax=Microbacterium sp. TaxID=51671 RepID=UPI003D6DF654